MIYEEEYLENKMLLSSIFLVWNTSVMQALYSQYAYKSVPLYPVKGDVSDSEQNVVWGVAFWHNLGNEWRCVVRPHVPKSYIETYKSYDHMPQYF